MTRITLQCFSISVLSLSLPPFDGPLPHRIKVTRQSFLQPWCPQSPSTGALVFSRGERGALVGRTG